MKGEFFSILDYSQMIHGEGRTQAYGEALRRHIGPDSIVMDIGAGTGFFSLLACKFGAKKVIAIEPNEAIQCAKQSAIDNGFASRIDFFQGFLSDYKEDVKVDIIISDLRGALPLHNRHIPIIAEARARFLSPTGVMLPQRDSVKIALSSDEALFSQYESLIRPNAYDIDMSAGYKSAINLPSWIHPKPSTLMSKEVSLYEIDYNSCVNPNFKNKVVLTSSKDAKVYGIVLWFDAEIDAGLTFSNAPKNNHPYYRSMFLPFEKPVSLLRHDRVDIDVRADLVGSEYVWTWKSQFYQAKFPTAELGFKQSTFFGGELKRQSNYS